MAELSVVEIQEMIPHRFPFLFVDKILELEPGVRAKGLKNVSINEPFFQGHYPGMPIMPGVVMLEGLAQTGAVVLMSDPKYRTDVPVLGAMHDVKFRRIVVPGDQLIFEVELVFFKARVGRCRGAASVNGELVLSGEMTFKLIPKGEA
jgi:3-hydroxyacyl-[acyl-carrier-protein] dehydratase